MKRKIARGMMAVGFWIGLAVVLQACGYSGGSGTDATQPPDAGPSAALEFMRIADLDAAQGENPFGIAVLNDGNLLVSMPFRKELRVYGPSGELIKSIATRPSLAFLALDDDGTVLAGSTALLDPGFDPNNPDNFASAAAIANTGLWRIDVAQETVVQIAQMPPDIMPTHFVLHADGYLVSNLLGDQILFIDGSGTVSTWIQSPLLAGSPDLPGPAGRPPLPIGIEGIERDGNNLLGVVADLGRIVRIPILPDGSAGEVEILFEAPEQLLGIADFVIDDDGDLYAISGFQSMVWKIDVDGGYVVTTLADHSSSVQVDTPGQIVSGYGGLLFTNNAFVVNDEKGPPRPGITRIVHPI